MVHVVDIEDNNSSDAHDTLEDDQYIDHPGGIEEVEVPSGLQDDIALQGVKITTSDQRKDDNSPMHSSRGASISTSPEQISDAVSVHSLPAVLVTEPESERRPTAESPSATARPPPSPSRSPTPQDEGPLAQQQRRTRHRSTAEVCAYKFFVLSLKIIDF